MKSGTHDYIYIYDADSDKIIIIDGETGEEIHHKNDRVTSVLNYLKENKEFEKLRKFAVWCAHQANATIKPIQAKMFDLAERAIYDEADADQLKELYDETEGTAIATDTVGLQYGSTSAPAFLASRECINPNAYEGAFHAARFHRLWAGLIEQKKNAVAPYLKEIEHTASEETTREAEQAQIDYLLDLMGKT